MPEVVRRKRRTLRIGVLALMLLTAFAGLTVLMSRLSVPPRSLAPYIEHRLSDHGPVFMRSGRWLAKLLTELDRGQNERRERPALRLGARAEVSPDLPPNQRAVSAATPEQILEAVADARPGDVITLEPGSYAFGSAIEARQPGKPDAAIIVRAARPGTVVIEVLGVEGFLVSAPYWTFENLVVQGACEVDSQCEHAFHIVGAATHFIARNNKLVDFNAHFKVNGEHRRFPDHGLIENNTIRNTSPRQTEGPVTPIDIVAASHWTVRGNLISDFVKARADRISYGAFAKGGGSGNRFERNVVLCEDALRGQPGWRVGISLGGGGSVGGGDSCRDRTCVLEQSEGTIEANLVASCSDDGIYINRSAMSRLVHNTLVDTGGIVVRFPQSSAEVQGNLVDGTIRMRDEGSIHARDNLETGMTALYFGRHPQRALFRDGPALDLRWQGIAPRLRLPPSSDSDLCGTRRPALPAYGAFEDFSTCLDAINDTSAHSPMPLAR
jgi:parallel beta-helix repeat protein